MTKPTINCIGAYGSQGAGPDSKWKQLIEAMNTPGQIAEIDAETFDYWLGVLPPIFMGKRAMKDGRVYSFGFAEGAETIKGFWTEKDDAGIEHHFVEDTGVMNPYA